MLAQAACLFKGGLQLAVWEDNQEFLSAIPANGIRMADLFPEPRSDGTQHFIAGGMSKGIVDTFEMINIHE